MATEAKEVKAYRVREEDGYCWIDPTTRRPQPGRRIVMVGEDGIEGQRHKLQPLTAKELEELQRQPAASRPTVVTEETAPRAPRDRMVRPGDVRRRNRKKEDYS